ncbi:hypothetical protein HAX54_017803, partial [Datura stramonium]|nr:hypothetical protein [Datura stramonium]
ECYFPYPHLPESLGNLKELMVLDLLSNYMGGSLPPELGNLKAVIEVDLSMNQFSNGIPREIGGLQNVVHLSMIHNKLKGSISDSMRNMIANISSTSCMVKSSGVLSRTSRVSFSSKRKYQEMFTRRNPNDEMFKRDFSLKRWVSTASGITTDVVGRLTLQNTTENYQFRLLDIIMKLILDCRVESPLDKDNMKDVVGYYVRSDSTFGIRHVLRNSCPKLLLAANVF